MGERKHGKLNKQELEFCSMIFQGELISTAYCKAFRGIENPTKAEKYKYSSKATGKRRTIHIKAYMEALEAEWRETEGKKIRELARLLHGKLKRDSKHVHFTKAPDWVKGFETLERSRKAQEAKEDEAGTDEGINAGGIDPRLEAVRKIKAENV